MKGKTKTQNGITLVALIITIVVLLILAVVAITAIQDEDLIGKVNSAATTYNQSVVNEGTQLGNYAGYLDGYLPKSYKAYTQGQEVKVTKDGVDYNFYVLTNSDATQANVTLLAKYCLGTPAEGGYSYPMEEYSSAEEQAVTYGQTVGAISGRLITKAEADSIIGVLPAKAILGFEIEPVEGMGVYWWTSTEGEKENAGETISNWARYLVQYRDGNVSVELFQSYMAMYGDARPVIEIEKSKVTLVTVAE